MNDLHPMIETEARHRIAERVARAAQPRLPSEPRHREGRNRIARGLRRVADRLEL